MQATQTDLLRWICEKNFQLKMDESEFSAFY